MDDTLKITNDKRHRSSSSLVAGIEGTRSERKLDIRASIPEVDDQFANAEARCEELQEKIDLVKSLRKKRKLKKRSMTTIVEPVPAVENVPFISVRAQPKKKVSQQAARHHRFEVPQRATKTNRGSLDADIKEQQQMLGKVGGKQGFKTPIQNKVKQLHPNLDISLPKSRQRRSRADGDATSARGVQIDTQDLQQEVACGEDDFSDKYQDENPYDLHRNIYKGDKERGTPRNLELRQQSKQSSGSRRRHVPKGNMVLQEPEVRPVVELFNKNRLSPVLWQRSPRDSIAEDKNTPKGGTDEVQSEEDVAMRRRQMSGSVTSFKVNKIKSRRISQREHQTRSYELPTISSKLKKAGTRCYFATPNQANIPFVVTKNVAPSHNVGVNLQQVLNSLKVKQPLSGIPLTLAHHMGLRHDPTIESNAMPSYSNSGINVITLGERSVRLPSHKHSISYNRLLALYRQGDGVVSRFLRANSQPHYFYTSMYNLATGQEDASTSKGRISNFKAKRSLAEYAHLYREYEKTATSLHQKYNEETDKRRIELAKELAARENYIRKVMQEFKPREELNVRATASTTEDSYRHSSFKLNGDV